MRLSVGTLRQVVKRDLSIAFVPQQLTSYGGLELLRLAGERAKNDPEGENDREPDPPQWGTSVGGWLAGSLADDGRSQESSSLVEPAYSMTLSARPSTEGGIVSLSALAVLRFMTSSNFVGCSTGRAAGLAPFRILST